MVEGRKRLGGRLSVSGGENCWPEGQMKDSRENCTVDMILELQEGFTEGR
jgi:hypothetical protein